jgi:hypothetical protein
VRGRHHLTTIEEPNVIGHPNLFSRRIIRFYWKPFMLDPGLFLPAGQEPRRYDGDRPTGLLNHTVLASEDQSSMLHYSQAVDKSAFRAFADKPMECAGRWSGS